MVCPHCGQGFHPEKQSVNLVGDCIGFWSANFMICPECRNIIIFLCVYTNTQTKFLSYPKSALRIPCPKEVPNPYAKDFIESQRILDDSPKASAAMSRRCLQLLLRDKGGVKPGKLYDEIEDAISKGLPSYVSDVLHKVREVGNIGAHPKKNEHTGEIIEIEPGEAELLVEVLDSLLDFYFVQPARTKERLDNFERRLRGESAAVPESPSGEDLPPSTITKRT